MDAYQRIVCEWCSNQNTVGATQCQFCGAPLDVKNLVSESGWREAPRLRDMLVDERRDLAGPAGPLDAPVVVEFHAARQEGWRLAQEERQRERRSRVEVARGLDPPIRHLARLWAEGGFGG